MKANLIIFQLAGVTLLRQIELDNVQL